MTLSLHLHHCQGGPPPSNLSSRPERSVGEGPAVSLSGTAKAPWANRLLVPFPHERKLQVPPLRFAPVGMTNLRVAVHLGGGGGGGTESSNSKQPGFGLPAFFSTHSASCGVQKAIRPLIWTALTLSRPCGTQFGEGSSHADSDVLVILSHTCPNLTKGTNRDYS